MDETASTFKVAVSNDEYGHTYARFLTNILISQGVKYELIPHEHVLSTTNITNQNWTVKSLVNIFLDKSIQKLGPLQYRRTD